MGRIAKLVLSGFVLISSEAADSIKTSESDVVIKHIEDSQSSSVKKDSLPQWDLTSFYRSSHDFQFKKDLETAREDMEKFCQETPPLFKKGITQAELLTAIETYEQVEERIGKLYAYTQLIYDTQMTNQEASKLNQSIKEEMTTFASRMTFFTLSINNLPDSFFEDVDTGHLRKYKAWIKQVRQYSTDHTNYPKIWKNF